ncbi:MAG: sensory transduction histidine kinase [Candidatus Methanoperedens nitroreducens]|uniref:Sensory transduction histidine kinase n=1 Tax=Candidatus Methanoperedens nitratireducens TaxID=1392998 RepID=A0A0P8CBQ2_9EURY|nr:PAS domain S-box protein [Candidatus Methanoperedens sp. BLZ2]KPQ44283.1 MAG: sensory transduction histidine kinase [Candidatus Methanoperedens sp. BLZ1]MBZ0176754.1 PAS domain S-box protein [Candidatus Methanoperedens nitroreducens]MCX9080475.1 PAS domain S-box protein [Candidatus Methanoperedens sp.]
MSKPIIRFLGTQLELYAIRKDGSEIPVYIALGPLGTEKGTVVMALVRDITERKRAEKNFQRFIESLPDAIVIIDSKFNILLVNAQTEKIFGYKRKELLGKPYDMLIPERFTLVHLQRIKMGASSRLRLT